jgi:hypothetical protein
MLLASVGLIMGTRMWYAMWDAETDDIVAFEARLDALCREVGDRGKLVSEAIPPELEPTLAPAPASASASAPVVAPAAPAPAMITQVAPAPAASVVSHVQPPARATPALTTVAVANAPTPTMHRSMTSQLIEQDAFTASGNMTSSLGELATFLEKQQHMQMEREERLDAHHREIVAGLEKKLEKQDRAQQLVALQARLETLHGANLLDDETLFLVEDAIADSEDVATDGRVTKLIDLSTKMSSDRAFARQLQRKKWL